MSGGAAYKGGIKAHWKRRCYARIDDERAVRARRRPGWRVRGRRILRALSPRRLLARLRDAYVRAMLRLASSAAVAGYGAAGDPFARPRPLVRECDEKALVEMYRSILAPGEAVPAVAAARLPAAV